MSAALMKNAEIGNRRWSSIGVDEWIQAGRWWLLKVTLPLFPIARYVNLRLNSPKMLPPRDPNLTECFPSKAIPILSKPPGY